jgi:uncharacterized membrane-anchored protein YjiN (DUF445 family)
VPEEGAPRVADDSVREARLDTSRRQATGLLVFALAIFVAARVLEAAHPWLGFVRATAEASLVGGLADWFAVTAIFRKPLGLPIPHTAIVATQKDRIGRVLGTFVQKHFLAPEVVAAELRGLGLADRAAQWLADPAHREQLARQVASALATTIETLPEAEFRELVQRGTLEGLQGAAVAPFLGNVLTVLTTNSRHQELLTAALRVVAEAVRANEVAIEERLRAESPWWVPGVIDAVIARRLVLVLEDLLRDVRADPNHPLRRRFEGAVEDFVQKLKSEPDVMAGAEAVKAELLGDPVVEEMAAALWDTARRSAARYRARRDATAWLALEQGLGTALASLLARPALRRQIDDVCLQVAGTLVASHREDVGALIARIVSGWDANVAVRRLELAIGSDLQYIRINGTLVGGLVGLLIHTVSVLADHW